MYLTLFSVPQPLPTMEAPVRAPMDGVPARAPRGLRLPRSRAAFSQVRWQHPPLCHRRTRSMVGLLARPCLRSASFEAMREVDFSVHSSPWLLTLTFPTIHPYRRARILLARIVRSTRSRCAGLNVRPRAPSRWRLGHEEEDLDDFSIRRNRVSGRPLPATVCSRALSPPARAQALSSPRSPLLLILSRTLLRVLPPAPSAGASRG